MNTKMRRRQPRAPAPEKIPTDGAVDRGVDCGDLASDPEHDLVDDETAVSPGPAPPGNGSPTETPAPGDGAVSLRTALVRHPVMFFVIVVVVTLLAFGVALLRSPTYTSESRLLVGQVDVEARAVPGFTQATQELASIYARVVGTDAVAGPVAKATGIPIAQVRREISASPIPDASIIRVEATSGNAGQATRLAQATAVSLSKYVAGLVKADPYQSPEYKGYVAAAGDLAAAQVDESSIADRYDQLRTPNSFAALAAGTDLVNQLATTNQQLVAAKARTLEAQLRANQLATAFQNATRGAGDTAAVELVAPAAPQGSDRNANLEIALVAGLVAGVLIGLAAVALRANRGHLRSLRARGAS